MLHRDKEAFAELIDRAASAAGFYALLMEKDYYLTLILSRVHELSDDLVFKGGTCLNKIYYSYYRLSEDLDFSMVLPQYEATRTQRRQCIGPVKDKIESFAQSFDMRIEGADQAGRNESRQYVYYFVYDSALIPSRQMIKVEIGLRFNPILPAEVGEVKHKFLHPFTGEPLFDGGTVRSLSLKEAVSEKLRAAALREPIAPRDFYDLDFVIRQGFDLGDPQVLKLFAAKVKEDGG
ncbi:MAG TPA: nucleotidyl transferase AbiEii/AbiGii toxin family protein, partial [Candidatus Omnitrophota bacterium]|nr:nucleotidyl transferase AbiEii/AbiGii toxin family protein [Candidatus Omnitrophota bacterium]